MAASGVGPFDPQLAAAQAQGAGVAAALVSSGAASVALVPASQDAKALVLKYLREHGDVRERLGIKLYPGEDFCDIVEDLNEENEKVFFLVIQVWPPRPYRVNDGVEITSREFEDLLLAALSEAESIAATSIAASPLPSQSDIEAVHAFLSMNPASINLEPHEEVLSVTPQGNGSFKIMIAVTRPELSGGGEYSWEGPSMSAVQFEQFLQLAKGSAFSPSPEASRSGEAVSASTGRSAASVIPQRLVALGYLFRDLSRGRPQGSGIPERAVIHAQTAELLQALTSYTSSAAPAEAESMTFTHSTAALGPSVRSQSDATLADIFRRLNMQTQGAPERESVPAQMDQQLSTLSASTSSAEASAGAGSVPVAHSAASAAVSSRSARGIETKESILVARYLNRNRELIGLEPLSSNMHERRFVVRVADLEDGIYDVEIGTIWAGAPREHKIINATTFNAFLKAAQ